MSEVLGQFAKKVGDGFERIANAPLVPKASTLLYVAVASLMLISLMMVASASMPFAIEKGLPRSNIFGRNWAICSLQWRWRWWRIRYP